MFYNQPLSIRFGTELLRHVDHVSGIEPYWDSLDIAVAWVRASGMAYLSDSLRQFLTHGGHLAFTVGIDLQNTTLEGLQALLDLEAHGVCETFVYHNEASSVFHPKLYLFRNDVEARLIVGSNNLTAAGLYANVEAGLQVDTEGDAAVIKDAVDALASWRDTSSRLAVKLDAAFLSLLSSEGYVIGEAESSAAIRNSRSKRGARSGARLFGSRSFTPPLRVAKPAAPSLSGSVPVTSAAAPLGTALLMRLRKASATARPTQTQIPFRVAETFFKGATSVESAHSGAIHNFSNATARGSRNTIKLEIPEMRRFADPVVRFEKTAAGIVYEVYDVGTPKGNQIMASLTAGRSDGSTQTSISDVVAATWWRYI